MSGEPLKEYISTKVQLLGSGKRGLKTCNGHTIEIKYKNISGTRLIMARRFLYKGYL